MSAVDAARLARWAARFRRGRLEGPAGVVTWEDQAPELETFAAWLRTDGPCEAALVAGDRVVVKLGPRVTLALPAGSSLRIVAPFGPDGRLSGPAVAETADGAWSLQLGRVGVPVIRRLALHPDGRLQLGRGVGSAAASRALGLALRATRGWASVARVLAT